jgi:invasion protein IalB
MFSLTAMAGASPGGESTTDRLHNPCGLTGDEGPVPDVFGLGLCARAPIRWPSNGSWLAPAREQQMVILGWDQRRRRTPARTLCAALLLTTLGAFAPVAVHAQGTVKSVHGDWQLRCDTPPGAQGEQCALIQMVIAENDPNVRLTVIVLKTADQKSRLMRVLAPLGVLLPSGLGLKIDDTNIGSAGFVRCLPNGCVAEVVMDEKLLGQLRTGKQATFIIYQTPEEGIGILMSLGGFSEGFDRLP